MIRIIIIIIGAPPRLPRANRRTKPFPFDVSQDNSEKQKGLSPIQPTPRHSVYRPMSVEVLFTTSKAASAALRSASASPLNRAGRHLRMSLWYCGGPSQNSQNHRVLWCAVTELTELSSSVSELSQKSSVGYWVCHRTHRKVR